MSLRYLFAAFLIVITNTLCAQQLPTVQKQRSFKEINHVIADNDQNIFIVSAGTEFTIVDQLSKLQIASHKIYADLQGGPSWGKTLAGPNKTVYFNIDRAILRIDPFLGTVDTVYEPIFPTRIINFTKWRNDPTKLLIVVKAYDLTGPDRINYHKELEKSAEEFSKNCSLILFDLATGQVLKQQPTTHAITAFQEGHQNLLAGTFTGNVIEIDEELHTRVVHKPFSKPIHSVMQQGNWILTVPHEDKHFGPTGEGIIQMFNTVSKKTEQIKLPEEKAPEGTDDMVDFPRNGVMSVHSWEEESSFLINYGFTTLMKLELLSLKRKTLKLPRRGVIHAFGFTRNGKQLVCATASSAGVFGPSGQLEVLDLNLKDFRTALKTSSPVVKFEGIRKVFDSAGNYHYIAKKKDNRLVFPTDSLIIFSSNRSNPAVIRLPYGIRLNDTEGSVTLANFYDSIILYPLVLAKLPTQEMDLDNHPISSYKTAIARRKVLLNGHPQGIQKIKAGKGSEKLLFGYDNEKKSSWATLHDENGDLKLKIESLEFDPNWKVSASKQFLAFENKDSLYRRCIDIWDLEKQRLVKRIRFNKDTSLSDFCFDLTQDLLYYNYIGYNDPAATTIEIEAKGGSETVLPFNQYVSSFLVDKKNNLVIMVDPDELSIRQLYGDKVYWRQKGTSYNFDISKSGNEFHFSSETEFYSVDKNYNQIYFTCFEGLRPLEVYNNQFYRGDRSSVDNITFVINRKGYVPTDFDMYFNRPDTVVIGAGSRNVAVNELYAKSVQKRRKHAGLVLSGSPWKEGLKVTLVNAGALPEITREESIKLKVRASSTTGSPITAIHIKEKGVPVFGSQGYNSFKPDTIVELELSLPLVEGRNFLNISVADAQGAFSPSETAVVFAEFSNPGSTYFIGVGIDKFAEPGHNLNWCVKDIRDLARKYAAVDGKVEIDTLLDEDVTVENIMKLKSRLMKTEVHDKIVFAYSGHGLLNKEYDYYLSTYNTSFDSPSKGGLPYYLLERLLDSIPARKKLLLIDACHSGEVDKEEMENFAMSQKALEDSGTRSGRKPVVRDGVVGMKNSFQLMQEIFSFVGRSTGTIIISAAAGTQLAQEREDLQNGVFTYSILEFLNQNPSATVFELKTYVNKRVSELTGGLQVPTTRTETNHSDWKVW